VQLFLSTVSDEFRSYRDHLRHALDRPNVTVKVQEDFIVSGTPTLEMLDDYIRHCDGVIHLVGDMTGSPARAQSLAAIQERYPDLGEKLTPIAECLQPGGPSLSYTQWEAWLALLHGRKLFIATADAQAPRDGKYVQDPAQIQAQQAHLCRLRGMERYPGVTFTSADHLALNLLRSYILDGLVEARLDLLRPPPTASGWTWPRPMDFSGYLREKRQGFIGRRWLFDAVRAWHGNQAASQALLIVADFGVGKSAFMAELTATGTAEQGLPIAAHHFCDHNTAASIEAATFVRSVATQLAGALPAYHAAVEADPEARRWLEEAQTDPASAFSQAVIGKLQGIVAPAAPMLLLVDGLDETLAAPSSSTGGNDISIVALLASGTGKLPRWLRVLATSRRRQEVRQPLDAAYACDLLDAEEARNLSDIHDYVLGRCGSEPLATRLAQAGTSPEQLAERLADFEQSGGKFLYAVRVLNDLASPNGALKPDRLDDLPRGMEGFYLDAFRYRFPAGEDFEPMRALLGVLCAQREPLGRKELAAILSVGEPLVQLLLARIEDFLRITNKLYAFDHLSLVQWLNRENDDGFPHAGAYAVPPEAAQQRIRAWARAEVAAGRANEWPYLTRHLAAHLEPGERQECFSHLLLDLCWLEARLRLADITALLSDWQWITPTPELTAVERALRQGAHVLIHQGQGWNDLKQLSSQLLARLPLDNPSSGAHQAEPSLRDQALAQLQKAGAPHPLTASLLGSEALLRTLTGHSSSVNALAVLHDGRLASGSRDGTIKLWDTATGSCAITLKGDSSSVNALAVLHDGRLASGSRDGTIKLWDTATGSCAATLKGDSSSVNALALLHDGRLASGSSDGIINIWDIATCSCVATLEDRSDHRPSGFKALAVLPDGRLASGQHGKSEVTIKLWDPANGSCTSIEREGHFLGVQALAVLSGGQLALGFHLGDFTIQLWDPATSNFAVNVKGHFNRDEVRALAALPDGRLASGYAEYDNYSIMIWDLANGRCVANLDGHTGSVNTLAVLPDGQLASGASDNTIKLWDLATGSSAAARVDRNCSVSALTVLPDGRLVSGYSNSTPIKLWAGGSCAVTRLEVDGYSVRALAALPDGRLARELHEEEEECWSHNIMLLDPNSGRRTATLRGHLNDVNCLAVLPDGRLASGSTDDTIKIWDISNFSWDDVATLKGHLKKVNCLAALPDGRLASGSDDNTVKIWWYAYDLPGWLLAERAATLKGHSNSVSALAVLPGGRLASGSADNTIKLWDWATGQLAETLQGHSGGVNALAVLPDRRLASGSVDRTIKLWDLASGEPGSSQLLFVADAAITALAFLTAASILVAGDACGKLHWLRLPET
jgi:WD40 repeat protein